MATGYEVEMYNNIKAIKQESQKQTKALESIAASLEKLATLVHDDKHRGGILQVDPTFNT